MTDRELLELAAKAAGYWEINGWSIEHHKGMRWIDHECKFVRYWNPLTDDGDALRLAVKLDIEFYRSDHEGSASYAGYWGKPERRDGPRMFSIEFEFDADHNAEPMTATRRAIVRAAAEIGKGME